jgi:hypothetical protein
MPIKKSPSTEGNQNILGSAVHPSKKKLQCASMREYSSASSMINRGGVQVGTYPIGNVMDPSTVHHNLVRIILSALAQQNME